MAASVRSTAHHHASAGCHPGIIGGDLDVSPGRQPGGHGHQLGHPVGGVPGAAPRCPSLPTTRVIRNELDAALAARPSGERRHRDSENLPRRRLNRNAHLHIASAKPLDRRVVEFLRTEGDVVPVLAVGRCLLPAWGFCTSIEATVAVYDDPSAAEKVAGIPLESSPASPAVADPASITVAPETVIAVPLVTAPLVASTLSTRRGNDDR